VFRAAGPYTGLKVPKAGPMRPCRPRSEPDDDVSMGDLRGFLERFRPTARVGVPGDRAAEQRAELAVVFAAMAPVETECREIRDAAERAASDVRARADQEAEALLSAARARVRTERTSAEATAGDRVSAGRAVILADAERLAARTRERAEERLPALVARAVEMVKKAITEGGE
jgi:hypothetical protein